MHFLQDGTTQPLQRGAEHDAQLREQPRVSLCSGHDPKQQLSLKKDQTPLFRTRLHACECQPEMAELFCSKCSP